MPLNDLVQNPIDDKAIVALTQLADELAKTLVSNRIINHLTPPERQQYGSINEQNKLLVNKVYDYHVANPAYSSPDVNWDLFDRNLTARNGLAAIESKLRQILEICGDTRILYDYSLYHNALLDYDYTKYKASNATGAGYTTKYQGIKQLFPATHKADTSTETTTDTLNKG
ncbi:hypothetical protein [Taibaiella soli]|uniref:Uncharacterized protein n=1 Tax=Taibaiella soli TaxID=1649169 RepID=A0A2W2B1W2_9BACT|nr:hypothetical protein [Taibaiella soli]PZF74008.1 hypothetical protein DN068_05285 [Taibaiella soli]